MQAPTDNLYKFMAIAGLVCSLFFYFDYNKRYDALSETINLQRMDTTVISAKIKSYQKKQLAIDQRIDELKNSEPTKERFENIRKLFEESLPGFDELILLQAKSTQNIEFLKESEIRLRGILINYFLFGAASLALCLYGMWLWYFRTQRYIDQKDSQVATTVNKARYRDTLPRRK